jgi:hypothetical protein
MNLPGSAGAFDAWTTGDLKRQRSGSQGAIPTAITSKSVIGIKAVREGKKQVKTCRPVIDSSYLGSYHSNPGTHLSYPQMVYDRLLTRDAFIHIRMLLH